MDNGLWTMDKSKQIGENMARYYMKIVVIDEISQKG